jgi:ligand-binding sensor domain-containing protein/signal transduction histidine kinase
MGQYNIRNLTTSDGLPQNSVKSIEIDKHGYVWLLTETGVCRYDGQQIRNIDNALVPKDFRPYKLTYYKDQLRIDYENSKKFMIHEMNYGYKFTSSDSRYRIYGIAFDRTWVDSMINAIYKYDLSTINHLTLFLTRDREFYFVSKDSLFYVSDNLALRHISTSTNEISIVVDSQLVIINPEKKSTRIYNKGILVNNYISDKPPLMESELAFTSIFNTSQGSFLSETNKVYLLKIIHGQFKKLLLIKIPNIQGAIMSYGYSSTNRKYYIGTNTNGLYELSPKIFNTLLTTNPSRNNFYSQAIIGDYLISNNHQFNQEGVAAKTPFISSLRAMATMNNYFYYLLENNKTICRQNITNGEKKIFYSKIENEEIQSILPVEDKQSVYVATNRHLCILDRDSLKTLTSLQSELEIKTICQFSNKSILIGGRQGLYIYDIQHRSVKKILSNVFVRTIYKDKNKFFWLGSYMGGYYLYKGSHIYKMPMDNEKRLISVHAFHLDHKGRIWMSTNNGLVMVKYHDLISYHPSKNELPKFSIFTTEHGLNTNEFNGGCSPSSILTKSGKLSLPSIDGLVQFYPDSIDFLNSSDYIHLDEIQINHQIYNHEKDLKFSRQTHTILFEFSSPNLGSETEIIYEYKIRDHNTSWQMTGKYLMLAELPPGEYQLEIRSPSFPNSTKKYLFSIEPYFYETLTFKILCLLGLVLSLYYYYRYKTHAIRRKNEELSQLVASKTKDLKDKILQLDETINELEKSELELSQLTVQQNDIIKILLHDLRSPMLGINLTISKVKEIILSNHKGDIKKIIIEAEDSIRKINKFVNDFFDWIHSQKYGFRTKFEEFQLEDIYRKLNGIFEGTNQIVFQNGDILLHTDKQILMIIIRNLIDNANQNTDKGIIIINAKKSDQNIAIFIEDDGKGFKYQTLDEMIDDSNYDGYGLRIIKLLLAKIKGKISYLTTETGTMVQIDIPILDTSFQF